ncbi:FAD-dependent monooxygenase [Arthrobacter zhaoguopingii]|uniref:FAD-dependent monooxygenase n=1 Tax=Arthrobacter zhaoguopingii TaxID=2681491 RepID=UPI001357C8B7|nr:FAD-dependent monooxygenase [Arthrobacter zhaoguopingii]
MAASEVSTDVLIVGAGPTGLMLAAWLRGLGVDAVLADGKGEPTRESRALGIQSRTMEIYDQLGVIGPVLEQAQKAFSIKPGYGRRSFGEVPLAALGEGLTPHPGLHFLEQSKNERILLAELQRRGGDVLWNRRLTGLSTRTGGATAEFSGPEGPLTVTARYVVGCDGGSSAVRTLSGIPFEGVTNEYVFYVADALDVQGLSAATVELRLSGDDFLLAFPLKGTEEGQTNHRLIGVLRSTGTADIVEDVARGRLSELFGVTYGTSRWFSTYRVHHRVAAAFRAGPVFLAGDAGHIHSPVGAQGMNTGLQDAHNLAFKLADVLAGRAGEELLDRYNAERRPVALRLVSVTDRVFAGVTSGATTARTLRRILPRLAGPVAVRVLPAAPIAPRFAGYLGQIRIHYWMSEGAKAAARGRRGRVVGRRLPWTGPNFAPLADAVWQVHSYGDTDAELADALGRALGLPVHRFPAAPAAGLRPDRFYLVRPDGFVAAEAPAHRGVSALRAALPPGWTPTPEARS